MYLDNSVNNSHNVDNTSNGGSASVTSNQSQLTLFDLSPQKEPTDSVEIHLSESDTEIGKLLTYDLIPVIPNNSSIKQSNISLYGVKNNASSLSLIKAGLPLQVNSMKIDSNYANLELKVSVEYEDLVNDNYVSFEGKNLLALGSNTVNYQKNIELPSINNDRDLVDYLVKRINSLEKRIALLENK